MPESRIFTRRDDWTGDCWAVVRGDGCVRYETEWGRSGWRRPVWKKRHGRVKDVSPRPFGAVLYRSDYDEEMRFLKMILDDIRRCDT